MSATDEGLEVQAKNGAPLRLVRSGPPSSNATERFSATYEVYAGEVHLGTLVGTRPKSFPGKYTWRIGTKRGRILPPDSAQLSGFQAVKDWIRSNPPRLVALHKELS